MQISAKNRSSLHNTQFPACYFSPKFWAVSISWVDTSSFPSHWKSPARIRKLRHFLMYICARAFFWIVRVKKSHSADFVRSMREYVLGDVLQCLWISTNQRRSHHARFINFYCANSILIDEVAPPNSIGIRMSCFKGRERKRRLQSWESVRSMQFEILCLCIWLASRRTLWFICFFMRIYTKYKSMQLQQFITIILDLKYCCLLLIVYFSLF